MRALILSDIHGNLEALSAVLASAGTFDELWNLGDAVGYGASPNEVVALLRQHATASIRGNHDKVCSGLVTETNFNSFARDAAVWTRDALTHESTAWLRALPTGPLPCDGGSVAIAHGSPGDEDRYLLSIRDAFAPLQEMTHSCTFFGHTHVQGGFGRQGGSWVDLDPRGAHTGGKTFSQVSLHLPEGERFLVNPGSVGQPRDGDWRAAFALYDTDTRIVTFCRVPYDLTQAQMKIFAAHLPQRLAARLAEGR